MNILTQQTGAPPVPPFRRTPLTGVSVAVPTRDELNRLALDLSAQVGRRLSLATLVVALLEVARSHPDELAAVLALPDVSGASDD